ncbi:hypothetical protein ACF3VQ_09915 [Yersinia sp. HM-2024]|uniref:hypothetical protein n=1 Tax=Yersinia sp. HM-2024 TaxID=3344550 RepID=UPI00370DBF8E
MASHIMKFCVADKAIYRSVAGGATAPMGAPAAYAATTHSAHFPANHLVKGLILS